MNYVDHLTDQNQTVHTLIDVGGRASIAPTESTSTSSKAYAVGDLFYYEGVLYKVITAIAQGDSIVTSGSGQNVEVDTIGADTTKLNQKVSALQKTGCMNVLPNYLTSQVVGGVTLDVNNNGIITANSGGAVASNVIVNMLVRYNVGAGNKHFLPNGIYKLLGSNNSRVHLSTFVTKNGAFTSLAETNSAEGAVFTVNGDDSSSDGAYVGVSIRIDRGDAISNVVIKPMITPDLSATYDDYQPYSMTNRELTEANSNLIDLLATKVTTSSFIYKTTVQPNGEAYIPLKYQCTIVIFVVRHDIAGNVYVYTGAGSDWFYSTGLLKIHESSNKISINGSKAQTDNVLTVTSTETYAMTVYAMYLNIV